MTKRILLAAIIFFSSIATLRAEEEERIKTSFTWGAEIGAGIDLAGHDMSDINVTAYFGLSNRIFKLLGIGAGINMAMSNSTRSFPIFGIVQTSFGVKKAPLFADFRIGCAFNNISDDKTRLRTYLSPGIGINLATGSKYRSYMILSYVYNDLQYDGANTEIGKIRGLNYANIAIGITF